MDYLYLKAPTKNLWNGQISGFYIGYRAANSNQDLYKTIESVDETNKYESHLTNLLRSTVYFAWVQAFNAKGAGPRSDQVSVKTLADVPPSAPILKVHSTTTNSITISWSSMTSFGNSVNQFTLYQRSYSAQFNINSWKETSITNSEMKHTVSNLECGKSYEFYMTAHNSVGKSEPSATIIARTDGEPPLPPKLNDILSNTASHEVTVNLMAWRGGQCSISHFSIKIRPKLSRNWNVITTHYSSTQNYVIRSLLPNTHYELETTAHSSAGSTQSLYEFTTINVTSRGKSKNSNHSKCLSLLSFVVVVKFRDCVQSWFGPEGVLVSNASQRIQFFRLRNNATNSFFDYCCDSDNSGQLLHMFTRLHILLSQQKSTTRLEIY